MKTSALVLLLLALLGLVAHSPLHAQDTPEQGEAKRIVDQPPYRGYRIERRPEPQQFDDKNTEGGRSYGDGDGNQGPTHGRQRGGGADGPNDGEILEEGGPDDSFGPSWSAPDWLAGLMQVLIWGVLIVAGLLGIYFLVRALLGIKWKRKDKGAKAKAGKKAIEGKKAPEDELPAPELGPEFVDALVAARAELEKALAAGDFGRAALLRWRIFWLEAGWRACVEEAEVRTWRDALALLRDTDMRVRMRGLLRLVENVRYGRHLPAATEFDSFRAELDHIPTRGVLQ